MRLSAATVDVLSPDVARYSYERPEQATGIVHFGIGAFHRAHQAVYTDAAMSSGDRGWGIAGVSLRSRDVPDRLGPQDGLYTVTSRGGRGDSTRLVGAVRQVLAAPHSAPQVVELVSAPATRLVSVTITEKGYHARVAGGLDVDAPPLAADLAGQGQPRTIYGFIRDGLVRRREAGLPGLTFLSCDNLPENGRRLFELLAEFLERRDASLRSWFEANCACPSSMVDRIVPATESADLDSLQARIGVRDEGAVFTEPFSQWVIEDRFAGERPRWEEGGALVVEDVRPFEAAKLRMLNGAHSALAYLGLERGHAFVHEAVRDPEIRPVVESLFREAAETLPPRGPDAAAYARALLDRFENPALGHRLAQIAIDGSQKIPQRWLAVLADQQRRHHQCPAILSALAAWILFVRGDRGRVDDPMAERLAALWREAGAEGIVDALFGESGILVREWRPLPADRSFLQSRIEGSMIQ